MTRILVVLGCLGLSATAAAAPPSFASDVAPILYTSCVSCHRPGEVAPMSLISYEDVRPWAKSIRAKVANREMPPWGADPHYGTFKDDRSLSPAQIDTIAKWADAGAPSGDDADLPPVPAFAAGWSHGEPDVVIEMPVEFAIPAEGEVPVIDFFTKSPFTQDVLREGARGPAEGTPGVIHHAGALRDRQAARRRDAGERHDPRARDGKEMSRNQVARANGGTSTQEIQKLLSFVPGRGYEEYQGDAGQLIKAGSYIDFYMHYTPTGQPAKDRSRLGLYFAKHGQAVGHQIYHSFGAAGPTALHRRRQGIHAAAARRRRSRAASICPNIPPYAENFKVVSVHTITEPVTLYGLTPHLHLRGKSMRYTLTAPDGREEVLLDVPKYDFNWQIYYELADAEADPRRQQGDRRHAVRQQPEEPLQPGAGERSVLVGAELGRDVRAAGAHHRRQPRAEEQRRRQHRSSGSSRANAISIAAQQGDRYARSWSRSAPPLRVPGSWPPLEPCRSRVA